MKRLSTRAQLVLLILAAALPALALSVYTGMERRAAVEAGARGELDRAATLAAQQVEESIDGVRQMLLPISISANTLIQSPEACSRFFSELLLADNSNLYHSMGLIAGDGAPVCSGAGKAIAVSARDRRYFRLAMEHGYFAVGEFQVGRVSGQPGINFAFPIFDELRRPKGVAFAGMNLARLSDMFTLTPLPLGATLTVYDHQHTILIRNPVGGEKVGDKATNPALTAGLDAGRGGTFHAIDAAGALSVFAVKRAGINPDGSVPFRIAISIPKQLILADANRALFQTAGGITLATLLLLLAAWKGAGVIVLRKIETMLDVARRVHDGDLSARTGLQKGKDELSVLGAAIDEMAQALQDRGEKLNAALRQLAEQATTDPLTGLHNRRSFSEHLDRELLKAERARHSVALIMLDVDHFKRVNDTWGHETGDRVLEHVAAVVQRSIRRSDIACRFGGEEFVAMLPQATREVALARAEAICRELQRTPIAHDEQSFGAVTASLGVALYPDHGSDAAAIIRCADACLYEAKRTGRNRVVMHKKQTQEAVKSTESAMAHA